jgi:hypothetical protein
MMGQSRLAVLVVLFYDGTEQIDNTHGIVL